MHPDQTVPTVKILQEQSDLDSHCLSMRLQIVDDKNHTFCDYAL